MSRKISLLHAAAAKLKHYIFSMHKQNCIDNHEVWAVRPYCQKQLFIYLHVLLFIIFTQTKKYNPIF